MCAIGTEKEVVTNVVQPKFESAKDRAIRQVVEMMQGTDEAGCERIVGAVGEALRTYSSQVKANAE